MGLFLQILSGVLIVAMIIRIAFSWIGTDPNNPLYQIVHEITEHILGPIRSVMPRMGMFDLSPMIAMFLLFILLNIASELRSA